MEQKHITETDLCRLKNIHTVGIQTCLYLPVSFLTQPQFDCEWFEMQLMSVTAHVNATPALIVLMYDYHWHNLLTNANK